MISTISSAQAAAEDIREAKGIIRSHGKAMWAMRLSPSETKDAKVITRGEHTGNIVMMRGLVTRDEVRRADCALCERMWRWMVAAGEDASEGGIDLD